MYTIRFRTSIVRLSAIVLLILSGLKAQAQQGTRNSNETIKGNVMVIPFEPFLYMSEIDKKINEQSKWTFIQIREFFRKELDVKLSLKLKPKNKVVSFYMDSIKMAKDLDLIYKSRTLSYDLVDPKKNNNSKNKNQKPITNGQVTVEINNDLKFMNAKIINPKLLGYLNKKYGVDYFIFINELDIKYDLNSYDIATDSYQRIITVHYTIMDKNQKVISAGLVTSTLQADENNPKKIADKSFQSIIDHIAKVFTSGTTPASPPPSGN